MQRLVLISVIILSFSVFLYAVKHIDKDNDKKFKNIPLLRLFYVGFVLVFIVFGIFMVWDRESTEKKYIPPSYRDGELVEGRFE